MTETTSTKRVCYAAGSAALKSNAGSWYLKRNTPCLVCADARLKSVTLKRKCGKAERIADIRKNAFSDPVSQNAIFDLDDNSESELSVAARKYAEKFGKESKWLFLYGRCGTGKSFFATCICNAVIDKRNVNIRKHKTYIFPSPFLIIPNSFISVKNIYFGHIYISYKPYISAIADKIYIAEIYVYLSGYIYAYSPCVVIFKKI